MPLSISLPHENGPPRGGPWTIGSVEPAHGFEPRTYCVAHNGSLIPVPGRDIMVQGWYQGGLSTFDFSDSANAVEIAYFDRGPVDPDDLISGGYWSSYW